MEGTGGSVKLATPTCAQNLPVSNETPPQEPLLTLTPPPPL